MTFKKYLFFLGFGRWFVFSILCAFLYLKRSFLFVLRKITGNMNMLITGRNSLSMA